MTTDPVNHPQHYLAHRSGIECIQITEHFNFCLGNALKYIWRADEKGDAINDLAKAAWYIEREISRRKALADIENGLLIGVIADCLEKDMLTKSVSSTSTFPQTNPIEKAGTVLAYAQAGDARRQNQMAMMCYYGDCMPQDYEAAVEWWHKAAEQGNYEAQIALVNAYRTGTGVPKDEKVANYWLDQAGSQRTEEERR
jgi:TPR repeat protein